MWQHMVARRDAGLVLVFSPHPDDEVIACGGTIARHAAEGARVRVVFSTDGAMSHAAVLGIESDPSPPELREIRQGEARAAAKAMGLSAESAEFLGFPDTRLADHLPEFRREVTRVLRAHPEVSVVYLPHEIRELNADHRLTGEVVLSCLGELGMTPALFRYVVWDERTEEEFAFVNRRPAADVPAGDERLVAFDITDRLSVKQAAFREHRTQVELFSPAQDRPVVPLAFQERVMNGTVEEFWTTEEVEGP